MAHKHTSEWLCISCGHVLGNVLGGELHPNVSGKYIRTSGPNLVLRCPECESIKTWYTSDQIVRAMYQLVNAFAETGAKSMMKAVSKEINEKM